MKTASSLKLCSPSPWEKKSILCVYVYTYTHVHVCMLCMCVYGLHTRVHTHTRHIEYIFTQHRAWWWHPPVTPAGWKMGDWLSVDLADLLTSSGVPGSVHFTVLDSRARPENWCRLRRRKQTLREMEELVQAPQLRGGQNPNAFLIVLSSAVQCHVT